MKLLIDDANIQKIKEISEFFPVDGVTTNPSILAKSGRPPFEVLSEIREFLGDKELHVQVISADAEGIMKEAAKILICHFMLFSDEKITIEDGADLDNEEFDEEILHMRQKLKTRLVDMNLSVRALNCLKSADVDTLGDLVQFNKADLLKFRNFGKKSLVELEELLERENLSFGTDISKYKLDKE